MAIYRGPGGAGDAVNDAASEVLLALAAKDAAIAAQVAAETAQAAAEAAQAAAELAETNAETAETNAETAETNAETAETNAETAQAAAEAAQAAAETAETNAETAATNAATSASAASTSASNAATSATNASNSASAAATSATNASNSASAAATSATNAANSATAASGSASAASTSATNAASSATAAAGSATSAANSATTATTQATNASNSASAASTSATNAANSASAASTSASNAATSATNASNSASAASTSASNAATSATNAANSATAAANSFDSFDDRYLGVKSSAPSLDNDGNALVNGALYFDSTLAAMRYYNTATATWTSIAAALETEPVRHSVRPSLLLDFANTKTLDPRITFTRGSTGTFYDGKTVAKAEENLFLQSQDFTTTWGNTNTTDSANTAVAPDGTTTADSIIEAVDTNQFHQISQAFTSVAGATYTFSVFLKANTRSNATVLMGGGSNFVFFAFDLSAGTVGSVQYAGTTWSSGSASITSVGNSWYRCVITGTVSNAAGYTGVIEINNGASRQYNGDGSSIYAWGAQLEQRSSVTAYTATTTAPITNYIPALQTAASGVARFEHNPVTGESLGLEIEEQRTNLLVRSEEFQTTWTTSNSSITANAIVAPDGTLTGDKLVGNTAVNSNFQVSQILTVTNAVHSVSVYLKAGEFSQARLAFTNGASVTAGSYFDLANGTVLSNDAGFTGSITPVGNGWYRCVTSAATGGTFMQFRIYLAAGGTAFNLTGNSWSGLYIWGAQVEAGAFATSYIKTEGSQVTRSADSASMTGANFSSWYRADEGTVYSDIGYSNGGSFPYVFTIESSDSNRIFAFKSSATATSATAFNAQVTTNGTTQADFTLSSSSTKFALAYKTNDTAGISNITNTVTTDTSCIIPVVSYLWMGCYPSGRQMNGTIKKLAFYPKRLTNSEIQSLTTI